jgi:beta-galactosidase
METAFHHDVFRSMKGGKPFLLMETTPSQVNWKQVSPLRRPGVHRLNGLQAVAHGSDAVCYFQLRRSRGSSEQFHGAVIDHSGDENNRVFREVTALGECLEKLNGVVGARVPARVAIISDRESKWALEHCSSAQTENKNYPETLLSYYLPLWKRSIAVDVIDSQASLEPYALVIAPMLFLLDDSRAENLTKFVELGGTLVATYHTGLVDESTRCFTGGAPGPLRKVLGLWVEEFDALPDLARRQVRPLASGGHGLSETYEARHYLDLVHLEGAEALAVYGEDFYAERPALTLNHFGKGHAYYVASRNDERFTDDFLGFLLEDLGVQAALSADLPQGVSAHCRTIGHQDYCFLLNFTPHPVEISLHDESLEDMETGDLFNTTITLPSFGSRVFQRAKESTIGQQ